MLADYTQTCPCLNYLSFIAVLRLFQTFSKTLSNLFCMFPSSFLGTSTSLPKEPCLCHKLTKDLTALSQDLELQF